MKVLNNFSEIEWLGIGVDGLGNVMFLLVKLQIILPLVVGV